MRLKVIARCCASREKPGTMSKTQTGAVTNRTAPIRQKEPLTPRNNVHASRRKFAPLSVASSGTSVCVSEKLATRKINCGKAPEAKNASVSMPTPRRVTTYHGIRTASTALQIASPASVRLSLIKWRFLELLSTGAQASRLQFLRLAYDRSKRGHLPNPLTNSSSSSHTYRLFH